MIKKYAQISFRKHGLIRKADILTLKLKNKCNSKKSY